MCIQAQPALSGVLLVPRTPCVLSRLLLEAGADPNADIRPGAKLIDSLQEHSDSDIRDEDHRNRARQASARLLWARF
jgi:hypothetical protein